MMNWYTWIGRKAVTCSCICALLLSVSVVSSAEDKPGSCNYYPPPIDGDSVGVIQPMQIQSKIMPRAILGTTPAEIEQGFSKRIEANFANGAAETVVSRLSDRELSDLATRYNALTTAGNRPLLAIFAQRLSDRSLVRVAGVFGKTAVANAVNAYSSPEVKASVANLMASAPATAFTIQPMAAPNIGMTIQEIYLEFRTAPIGSLGPAASLAETAMYSAKYLTASWWIGYKVGDQINNAINTYDPSLGDAIGGTVAGMVNAVQTAGSDVVQGHLLGAVDDLFGLPLWDAKDWSGDWDEFPSYEDFAVGDGCVP